MPLTVQQLNADTTFLLTISSTFHGEKQSNTNIDSTILIDPWLTGPSPIFHMYFAYSRHTTNTGIQSLAELSKPPDLVIVSQPKNDHCNRETLCTLPQSWKGMIVAVPAAAKKIRSWKYFEDSQIRVASPYSPKNAATMIRLPAESASDTKTDGEITIANIPEPYDISAVHNALGITYHPPSTSSGVPKPLSILYTPHGLSSAHLEPYLSSHLRPSGAYPVDLLFHSLNVEANPKLMGGVISNGAPGGVPIAKMLDAREWIGAHDEEKESGGMGTKLIRCRVYGIEEVEEMLAQEGLKGTRVRKLGVGETLVVDERRGGREESVADGTGARDASVVSNGHG